MSTILPENVTSWRDLADQLTPEQTVELGELEDAYRHRYARPWWSTVPRTNTEIAAVILARAREHAADNLEDALIGEVPIPPGVNADTWQDDGPMPYRTLMGANRKVPGWTPGDGHLDEVLVGTTAVQFADGHLDDGTEVEPPHVYVQMNSDHGLTSAEARGLAAVLLAAADEIDGWMAR